MNSDGLNDSQQMQGSGVQWNGASDIHSRDHPCREVQWRSSLCVKFPRYFNVREMSSVPEYDANVNYGYRNVTDVKEKVGHKKAVDPG